MALTFFSCLSLDLFHSPVIFKFQHTSESPTEAVGNKHIATAPPSKCWLQISFTGQELSPANLHSEALENLRTIDSSYCLRVLLDLDVTSCSLQRNHRTGSRPCHALHLISPIAWVSDSKPQQYLLLLIFHFSSMILSSNSVVTHPFWA